MFKKSKNNKLPPPEPPTIDEILSDIEGSFHIDYKAPEDFQGNNLDAWWGEFQQIRTNYKTAVMINNELNAYIPKLEASRTNLEKSEKQLKKRIAEQQAVISNVLENAS